MGLLRRYATAGAGLGLARLGQKKDSGLRLASRGRAQLGTSFRPAHPASGVRGGRGGKNGEGTETL